MKKLYFKSVFFLTTYLFMNTNVIGETLSNEDSTTEKMFDSFLIEGAGTAGTIVVVLIGIIAAALIIRGLLIKTVSDKIDSVTGLPSKAIKGLTSPITSVTGIGVKGLLKLPSMLRRKKKLDTEKKIEEVEVHNPVGIELDMETSTESQVKESTKTAKTSLFSKMKNLKTKLRFTKNKNKN